MSVFYFHGAHNETYFLNLAPLPRALYAAGRVGSGWLRTVLCLEATIEPRRATSSSSNSYGNDGSTPTGGTMREVRTNFWNCFEPTTSQMIYSLKGRLGHGRPKRMLRIESRSMPVDNTPMKKGACVADSELGRGRLIIAPGPVTHMISVSHKIYKLSVGYPRPRSVGVRRSRRSVLFL